MKTLSYPMRGMYFIGARRLKWLFSIVYLDNTSHTPFH